VKKYEIVSVLNGTAKKMEKSKHIDTLVV